MKRKDLQRRVQKAAHYNGVNWGFIALALGGLALLAIGTKKAVEKFKSLVPVTDIFLTDRARPVLSPYQYSVFDRSAVNYARHIDQFKVKYNPRYQVVHTDDGVQTWCNLFSIDVIQNAAEDRDSIGSLPRYWNFRDGRGEIMLRANDLIDWLLKFGSSYGWTQVDANTAQAQANEGHPTVAVWRNPNTERAGHMAVVRPGEKTARGVSIAQAGANNFNQGQLMDGFGGLGPVLYFTTA